MPVEGWVPLRTRLRYQKPACEHCGGEHRLGLHHLDEDRTNNSSENLLTLCASCHTRWHWKHGKRAWKRLGTCGACDLPARHLGWCNTHWSRVRRHGSPYLVKRKIGHSWVLCEERGTPNGLESRE